MRPLILTARLDELSQAYFNRLREQHFPIERNYLAAHLTLFHALPGVERQAVHTQLESAIRFHAPLAGSATGLRSLGRGVAFIIECPPLRAVREALGQTWQHLLTPQDRQPWRPHITVQNKVSPETAQRLLERLKQEFAPKPLQFEGFDLWHYDNGPWNLARSYPFSAAA